MFERLHIRVRDKELDAVQAGRDHPVHGIRSSASHPDNFQARTRAEPFFKQKLDRRIDRKIFHATSVRLDSPSAVLCGRDNHFRTEQDVRSELQ